MTEDGHVSPSVIETVITPALPFIGASVLQHSALCLSTHLDRKAPFVYHSWVTGHLRSGSSVGFCLEDLKRLSTVEQD